MNGVGVIENYFSSRWLSFSLSYLNGKVSRQLQNWRKIGYVNELLRYLGVFTSMSRYSHGICEQIIPLDITDNLYHCDHLLITTNNSLCY